jgi:hypothetical protein
MLTPHMRSKSKSLDPLDERWLLVQRIVASPAFRKSHRLSSFLTHITSAVLQDRADELSERHIGVDVFGRNVSYNPGDDSIVRASARLLRRRLDLYFQTEGADECLVVRIPLGTYVPVFEERSIALHEVMSAERPEDAASQTDPVATAPNTNLVPRWTFALAAVLVLLCSAAMLWQHHQRARTNYQVFWDSLFPANRRTLVVPADTTLFALAGMQETPLTLSEYLNHRTASGSVPLTEAAYLGKQYTSIADLNIAFRIGRLEETQGKPIEIRYTRNLTWDDVKSANLILLGGPRSNPWAQLYQDRLDYLLHSDNVRHLASATVRVPMAGEKAYYEVAAAGDSAMGFGLIAMVQGVGGRGHTLLIEGTNMAGTEAACDYVLDPARFQQIARRIVGSDGQMHNFEALLMTKAFQGNSSEAKILSLRRLP